QHVQRRAADDVPAGRGLAIRARVDPGADLELRVVDRPPQRGRALDVHRALAGVERVRRAGVVDARVVEVATVDAGLPPVEDGLPFGAVPDDLGRAIVPAVAVVAVERAGRRHELLEEPAVDRRAEA